MPRYPYFCESCEKETEIIKSLADYDSEEICDRCEIPMGRRLGLVNFTNAGDWKPTYNPAFGRVVRSRAHQREILAEYKGEGKVFEEIGNEPVEKIHKRYDTMREDKRKERWNEPIEKVLHEALK